jgi:hypothetical protein
MYMADRPKFLNELVVPISMSDTLADIEIRVAVSAKSTDTVKPAQVGQVLLAEATRWNGTRIGSQARPGVRR